MPNLKISIILPVYNPSPDWVDIVLSKCEELILHYPDVDFEFIIVNDGSDASRFLGGFQRLKKSYLKLLSYEINKGKGYALRQGVSAASGQLTIYTDIDFPYTIASICSIIDMLQTNRADIVIGVKDPLYYEHVPAFRRFISILFRVLIKLLFRIPTDDTQCGLKGFNQSGKDIFLQTTIDRYLFDLEFVFLAVRQKNIVLKTHEVKLREDVYFSKMNFGILRNELGNFIKILLK